MSYDLNKRLKKSVKDFCANTNLNGYKYLQQDGEHKLLWSCLHVFLVTVTIYLVVNLWQSFMENPTITFLDNTNYPVSKVPFPGICVCDVNKISKRKSLKLANTLANLTGKGPKIMLDYVRALGSLYDFNVINLEKLSRLQTILDRFYGQYKIQQLTRMLATSCGSLLSNCSWQSTPVDCSQIFTQTLTSDGYCCTFNYLGIGSNKTDSLLYGKQGFANSLTFFVNNKPEDYFYTSLSTVGAQIGIFSPTDFPDRSSGGVKTVLVGATSETILEILPLTINPVNNVRHYPLIKRKCVFPFERKSNLGVYSLSNCLISCRARSMLRICGCIPFMIPIKNKDLVCSLTDLPCLYRYKSKWFSRRPFPLEEVDQESLGVEVEDGLYCDGECLPNCGTTLYDISANPSPLYNRNDFNNVSIVHVFYRNRWSNYYQHEVIFLWFEILSSFGGLFGLIMGFSGVTLVEIVVYFGLKMLAFSKN